MPHTFLNGKRTGPKDPGGEFRILADPVNHAKVEEMTLELAADTAEKKGMHAQAKEYRERLKEIRGIFIINGREQSRH